MLKGLLLLSALLPMQAHSNNLDEFVPNPVGHPVCGINALYPASPPAANGWPSMFAYCRTIASGVGVKAAYPDRGTDALAKLLIALLTGGGFEQKFFPLSINSFPPNCSLPPPPLPPGLDAAKLPPLPPSPLPSCNLDLIRRYLTSYDQLPVVQEFKRMVTQINALDLSQQVAIDKLQRATAVVAASGGKLTFGEIAEILK